MLTAPQGTRVKPRSYFAIKVNGKGREIRFFPTDRCWVASPQHTQRIAIEVCRINKPKGTGYTFTQEQFDKYFEIED